jgi:hypothetical protein
MNVLELKNICCFTFVQKKLSLTKSRWKDKYFKIYLKIRGLTPAESGPGLQLSQTEPWNEFSVKTAITDVLISSLSEDNLWFCSKLYTGIYH